MIDDVMTDAELRREAIELFEAVIESGRESDGTIGWVSYDIEDGVPALSASMGLYRGQLGIAAALAGLAHVVGDESYLMVVDAAVEFIFERDADELLADLETGLGNGVGSIVYGLSLLTSLTGDDRYRKRAVTLVESLTESHLRADDAYDVLYGTAGTLLGLLRLHEQRECAGALEAASICGEHLLANRFEKWGYEVWDTYDGDGGRSFSTGMARGAAGISYALYRLYGHTGRESFREAATAAVQFENVFYSADATNWKANWLSVPTYPDGWCYGRTGIGIARLGSLAYHETATLYRDLDRARSVEPTLAETDNLCHGTFSRVELLVELGRRFDDRYLTLARTLATAAIERKRELGGYRVPIPGVRELEDPTLFLGTAGIGWTILRVLRPTELPSVLRIE